MMNRYLNALAALLLFLAPSAVLADEPSSEAQAPARQPSAEEAVAAAKSWLQVVDSGNFDKSWEAAAPLFQKNVPEDSWSKLLATHRTPLGKVQNRELRSQTFFTSLPGAPEGSYWVLDFIATFEGGKRLYERITPMKVGTNEWRVSGYFLNSAGFSN